MNFFSAAVKLSKAAASFYANASSSSPIEMVACMKMVIISFYLATTGAMFRGNEEWDIIIACALGGFPGAVIGVFLAMFDVKNAEWKWHVYFLRWAVNLFSGTLLGPAAYKWIYPSIFKDPNSSPSPILALACGGAVGAVFLLMAQPFIPTLRRILDKRAEKLIVG